MGYVCVCNSITHDQVMSTILEHNCKQPIDVFRHCEKQPRCCTCFTMMSELIADNPTNVKSIDDISESGINSLKVAALKSLPHIWRIKREKGSILFYKNDDYVIIEVKDGQLVFTDSGSALNEAQARMWFDNNTSILKETHNE